MFNLKEILSKNKHRRVKAKHYITSEGLSDSLSVQVGDNSIERSRFPRNSLQETVFWSLGHINANPSNEVKVGKIRDLYVFANEAEIGHNVPNSSHEAAAKFVDILVSEAKIELERYNGAKYKNYQKEIQLLHGERGSGKTFFQNRVLFDRDFIQETDNIICVRIGVHDKFQWKPTKDMENPTLHFLFAKLLYVIYKYYYVDSKHGDRPKERRFDIHGEMIEWLNNTFKDNEIIYNGIYNKLKEMARRVTKSDDSLLNSSDVNLQIGRELIKNLANKGFSFIFIFDGLDRLELKTRFVNKLYAIIDQLSYILPAEQKLAATFLLVCRSEYKNEIIKRLRRNLYNIGKINFVEHRIMNTDFELILKRKREHLLQIARDSFPKRDYKQNEKHIITFFDVLEDEFTKFLQAEIYPSSKEPLTISNDGELCSRLHEVFGSNHRAKAQFLQLNYWDYASNVQKDKPYLLIERMSMGGYNYPWAPTFATTKTGEIIENDERAFDNVFLPNIFCYDYTIDWGKKGFANTLLLSGLRFLQILLGLESLVDQGRYTNNFNCKTIADILYHLFEYERGAVYSVALMLSHYDVVRLDGISINEKMIAGMSLKTKKKAKFIVDNFIREIAYLNMCSIRLPVSADILSCRLPAIKCGSPQELPLEVWAAQKICNAYFFIEILHRVNDKEKKGVKASISSKERIQYKRIIEEAERNFGLFSVFDETGRKNLLNSLMPIYNSLETTQAKEIVEKYFSTCDKQFFDI